jgi:hypothetical protein
MSAGNTALSAAVGTVGIDIEIPTPAITNGTTYRPYPADPAGASSATHVRPPA